MNGIEKTGSQTPVKAQIEPEKEKKLRKACADFEALLTNNMLKSMRRTIPAGGAISRSSSRDLYESMMDQQIAETVAGKGQGIGLQKTLYDQLSKKFLKNDLSSSGNASINETKSTGEDK